MERFDASQVKIFLELWGEQRGKKLAEYASFPFVGGTLCSVPANSLKNIYIYSDLLLGQELYDYLHVVEVRLTALALASIFLINSTFF